MAMLRRRWRKNRNGRSRSLRRETKAPASNDAGALMRKATNVTYGALQY